MPSKIPKSGSKAESGRKLNANYRVENSWTQIMNVKRGARSIKVQIESTDLKSKMIIGRRTTKGCIAV